MNPVKFLSRATGLSNITEAGTAANTEALRLSGQNGPAQQTTPTAPPPQPAPLVGQEAAPRREGKRPRQFSAAIIGTGGAEASSGGKTLLGQ